MKTDPPADGASLLAPSPPPRAARTAELGLALRTVSPSLRRKEPFSPAAPCDERVTLAAAIGSAALCLSFELGGGLHPSVFRKGVLLLEGSRGGRFSEAGLPGLRLRSRVQTRRPRTSQAVSARTAPPAALRGQLLSSPTFLRGKTCRRLCLVAVSGGRDPRRQEPGPRLQSRSPPALG